jgi:peptide/nickel transport system ATP-binding protein
VIPLLRVNLSASYGRQEILRDIQFSLYPGEALGFVGTSGAGKSTLVMALLGLLPWRGGEVRGEVLLNGQNLLSLKSSQMREVRGKRIALVPQSPMTALNSAISLRTHFEEAWSAHERRGRQHLQLRLEELLGEVQLRSDGEFLARRSSQISVGQAQRVMIALALLHRPDILIADEPTSALDPVTQAEIVRLMKRLNRSSGTALLYISHDLVSVLQICSRIAFLDQGRLVECLPVEQLEDARHPAAMALLQALPVPAHVLLGISGERSCEYLDAESPHPMLRQESLLSPIGNTTF